ncbi:bifunctional biotin--[acetyl-CoA-carboxylase] ligase/biotin operon repressor BirA [Pseudomonas tohonis]|uniref:bifunctional biotin--[acetyl-CoA-carboxylase] ligase/biotin operon repressor BirA n=1 Tax=Pseudomonas tohonis TaxID=2725477 RepID=UPI0021D93BDC|nr:bifunctional biotin--[acetyl-CoA-carboxylase] ligase/biotin operon repressor BirA [Pseudomonas tohonis]UXY53625.1 bifunctional biotin--[acetyl-CoA-carboxylase] ligase/biotin operon repressor BirA [Pseudomonas tohonis]
MLTLLKLLQDGQFHSGEELGRALGVSRSAVWKQFQSLEANYDVRFHKLRGKGYRLEAPMSLLDPVRLNDGVPGFSCAVVETVDSTNAEVMRRIAAGAETPFAVLAEHQSGGRGRRGREWVSPYGQNLYCSVGLRVEGGAGHLEGLSLVVGLAVLRAIRLSGLSGLGLKWPNDILVNGRKIAGILLELIGDPADICSVIIGIGINVNMRGAGAEISQPWTSILLESGGLFDRTALAINVLEQLNYCLAQCHREGFKALRAEWEADHLWRGREASLIAGKQRVDGVILGVDDSGALRMDVAGSEKVFSGGELSLRLRNDS